MIRVKLLMWNDGEKSLSQLQTSKVRRPPWRPRYCLIWIRRQWSRVNKWSPKFIIMNQVISHGAIGCSPVAMCVLQWRYDWSWSTSHHYWAKWVHVDIVCDIHIVSKHLNLTLKFTIFFRIVLNDWFSSYTRTDGIENMSLKVVLSFISKNESNLELHVVPMYLFESFEILKKYVRKR